MRAVSEPRSGAPSASEPSVSQSSVIEPSVRASRVTEPPVAAVGPLPCGAEGPVFREPWEAQAFAIVVALHQCGLFEWTEWARYLSEAIRQAQAGGDPDTGENYYRHWLSALERLVTDKGLAAPLALGALRQAWRVAAEITPHGQPVELSPAVRAISRRG